MSKLVGSVIRSRLASVANRSAESKIGSLSANTLKTSIFPLLFEFEFVGSSELEAGVVLWKESMSAELNDNSSCVKVHQRLKNGYDITKMRSQYPGRKHIAGYIITEGIQYGISAPFRN